MPSQMVARIRLPPPPSHCLSTRLATNSLIFYPTTTTLQHVPWPPRINGAKSAVHLSYDVKDPPSRPDVPHTRFVCVSDTHSQIFGVPFGDVRGDLSSEGRWRTFRPRRIGYVLNCTQPHKLKMCVPPFKPRTLPLLIAHSIIAGNHDLPLHTGWYEIHYLRFHKDDKQVRLSSIWSQYNAFTKPPARTPSQPASYSPVRKR